MFPVDEKEKDGEDKAEERCRASMDAYTEKVVGALTDSLGDPMSTANQQWAVLETNPLPKI